MFENKYRAIFCTEEDWRTQTGFGELLRFGPKELSSKISEVVLKMRECIYQQPFTNPTTSRNAWKLRRELKISHNKLNANSRGECLEDSVERLFVACSDNLYNQFAIIAGVVANQNRKSVDIIRVVDDGIEEMIEFKEWKPTAGHLLFAALEILENFLLYERVLNDDITSIYDIRKPSFANQVALTVLAPASYYGVFRDQAVVIAQYLNDAIGRVTTKRIVFSFQELSVDFRRDNCVNFFRSLNAGRNIDLQFIDKCKICFRERAPLEANNSPRHT